MYVVVEIYFSGPELAIPNDMLIVICKSDYFIRVYLKQCYFLNGASLFYIIDVWLRFL